MAVLNSINSHIIHSKNPLSGITSTDHPQPGQPQPGPVDPSQPQAPTGGMQQLPLPPNIQPQSVDPYMGDMLGQLVQQVHTPDGI